MGNRITITIMTIDIRINRNRNLIINKGTIIIITQNQYENSQKEKHNAVANITVIMITVVK